MKHLLLFLVSASLLPALAGCQRCAVPEPAPRPCYSGVVVGSTCYDGLLIDVDAATPIGRPSHLGNNVIGALNVAAVGSLGHVGQRLYFTCGRDTTGFANFGPCPAFGIPLNVPHMVLSAFSATSCPANSR